MTRIEYRQMLRRRIDTIEFADASITDLAWMATAFSEVPVEVDGDALALLRRAVS